MSTDELVSVKTGEKIVATPSISRGRQLVSGVLGASSVKLLSFGLSFVLSVLLARTIGAEQYGVYAFAIAVVSLLTVVGKFGLHQLVVREVAAAVLVLAPFEGASATGRFS